MKYKINENITIPKNTTIKFTGKNNREYTIVLSKSTQAHIYQLTSKHKPKIIPEKLKQIKPGYYGTNFKFIYFIKTGYFLSNNNSLFKGNLLYYKNSHGEWEKYRTNISREIKKFHNCVIKKVFKTKQELNEFLFIDML